MSETGAPSGTTVPGVRISQDDYGPDFFRRDGAVRDRPSWKLERRRHFIEAGNASWRAFDRGDWPSALDLMEERRARIRAEVADEDARRNPFHRVRVVEEPLTPYLYWELRYLRLQAECGRPVRVVPVEAVAEYESTGLLPEVVVLGGDVLYEVCYTGAGAPDGAVRSTDPELIAHWSGLVRDLYAIGEDVVPYTDRRVLPFAPPAA